MDNRAIGLLDSGVGGFTVLKELQENLKNENFIYIGDSKNLPYGEKSNEEIVNLVNDCIKFLESKNVKFIVLACNTASSLINQLDSNVPLFSIVDAGCRAVLDLNNENNIGLIATRATVNNKAYDKILSTYTNDQSFISYGTPNLARVINNQLDEIQLLKKNIEEAINPILEIYPVKYLLLGCTHFPIVSQTIKEMYPELTLINPAKKEIEILDNFLEENKLSSYEKRKDDQIYINGNDQDLIRSQNLLEELKIKYKELNLIEL